MSGTTRTIGVGLISVGWMGRLHTRAYKAVAERYPELGLRARLVIAADTVEASAREAADVLGYESWTLDYHEVLNHPEVDVVSICAPNFLHKEMALAAAKAGKPFWIEKPMGRGAAESGEIARAAHDAGIVTGVGFNYRHAPAVARARELIRAGELGRITNVRCWLLADYSSDPAGALTWRFERERAGSGVLGDLVSHGFDLAQFLVGAINEVTALSTTIITERAEPASGAASHFSRGAGGALKPVQNEDYVGVLARFASGAVGTFESSRVAVGPRAEYVVEVYGTQGSVRWNFQRLNELEVCLGLNGAEHGYTTVLAGPGYGEFSRFQPGAGTSMGFDDLKTIEARLFLESVATGKQLAPSAADGWSAASVADAAEESAADGAWHQVGAISGTTTYDA
ncbi:Gfo/Idh/MocA family oxidoreductase [Pengzhenrongella sp.]|jgi:predicted dehydrogenase|uniref:Gfo/Idh/MocA family protein n=1 Tax=Pengzhenrongella sp. TaxID=2888820 RepID=UPI002F93285A